MGPLYQNHFDPTSADAPRLLVDAMLGSLARWLRLLGVDAALASDVASDAEIVRQARAEERVIVTRDTELARRRGVAVLLLTSLDLASQLRQVLTHWPIGLERLGTRCLACNHPLRELPRAQALERVPPYVGQTQERFYHCPQCDRIYWAGTHWTRMCERLKELVASASG